MWWIADALAQEPLDRPEIKAGAVEIGVTGDLAPQRLDGDRGHVGAIVGWHPVEAIGVVISGTWSPQRADRCCDPFFADDPFPMPRVVVADQLTRVTRQAAVEVQLAPLHGTIELDGRAFPFEPYAGFGAGVVHSRDDLDAIQAEGDPEMVATEIEDHLSIAWTAGLRVFPGARTAVTTHVRHLGWTETIDSTEHVRDHEWLLGVGVSRFFGG